MTTEEFRSSPPIPEDLAMTPGLLAHRQETVDTVHRIMGGDIASPENPFLSGGIERSSESNADDASTTQLAKEQAAQVADTTKQAGGQVAQTVMEQAGQVTAEAGQQAKQLLSQAQSEVTEQAAATQQRVSDGLHSLADELAGMAVNSNQDGVATDLARQAAEKARQAAGWLADRDPGTLLDEVRSFARRKPGTYLAIALGAGVLSGRLARGLTAPAADKAPAASTSAPDSSTPELAPPETNGGHRNGAFTVDPGLSPDGPSAVSMPGLAVDAAHSDRGEVAP